MIAVSPDSVDSVGSAVSVDSVVSHSRVVGSVVSVDSVVFHSRVVGSASSATSSRDPSCTELASESVTSPATGSSVGAADSAGSGSVEA